MNFKFYKYDFFENSLRIIETDVLKYSYLSYFMSNLMKVDKAVDDSPSQHSQLVFVKNIREERRLNTVVFGPRTTLW